MSKELIELTERFLKMLKERAEPVCGNTPPSDPHAENKALYEQDALETDKPWERWQYKSLTYWNNLSENPAWITCIQYRRKQTKKRVDWIPLCKGANTNYGELFQLHAGKLSWHSSLASRTHVESLRLAKPFTDKHNWQAYNGEDLNLLHEAGFVVEVKFASRTSLRTEVFNKDIVYTFLTAYRVIAIRDGFTANPAEVV